MMPFMRHTPRGRCSNYPLLWAGNGDFLEAAVLVGGTVKQAPGRIMHVAIVTLAWILSITMKLTLIYLILLMNF